ncbi:hypothetical protein HY750_02355 [Candidatus Kuenenbacteria bacterium]|nr:hypothetical protein [Candidatus Kuenenbacteria bacterium]
MSEEINKISESKILDSERESLEEKQEIIKYIDLVKMYYYEALASQNPFYEKHFENIIKKIKIILLEYVKNYLEIYKSDKQIETAEGALDAYFESFYFDLEAEDESKKLFKIINAFIMYVHERLRLNLGEELLGISGKNLEALNYIDISKPLDEQERIIWNKICEENEKYDKNS